MSSTHSGPNSRRSNAKPSLISWRICSASPDRFRESMDAEKWRIASLFQRAFSTVISAVLSLQVVTRVCRSKSGSTDAAADPGSIKIETAISAYFSLMPKVLQNHCKIQSLRIIYNNYRYLLSITILRISTLCVFFLIRISRHPISSNAQGTMAARKTERSDARANASSSWSSVNFESTSSANGNRSRLLITKSSAWIRCRG